MSGAAPCFTIEPISCSMRYESIPKIDRVDGDVAHVGDPSDRERLRARNMMHAAHRTRLVPDFAGAVPGAGAIGRSAVPGNSNEGDVQPRGRSDGGQPHECRYPGKARDDRPIHRLRVVVLHGHDASSVRRLCHNTGQKPASALIGWQDRLCAFAHHQRRITRFCPPYGIHNDRRGRPGSGEGEPLRHRAGDAELAVPHRLLDHRARVAGRLLRADERQGRGGGAARRAAAAHRRVSGLHRRRDRGVRRHHRGGRRLHHQSPLSGRQPARARHRA